MIGSFHVNYCFEKSENCLDDKQRCILCDKIVRLEGDDKLAILHLTSVHSEKYVIERVEKIVAIDSDLELIAKKLNHESKSPRPNDNEELLIKQAEEFVQKYGANTRDSKTATRQGRSLLWLAVRFSRYGVLKYLAGVKDTNIDIVDNTGQTPLMNACSREHDQGMHIIKFLIDKNEQNLKDDHFGKSILETIDKAGATALFYSVQLYFDQKFDSLKIAMYLLIRGADIRSIGNKNAELAHQFFSQLSLIVFKNIKWELHDPCFIGFYPFKQNSMVMQRYDRLLDSEEENMMESLNSSKYSLRGFVRVLSRKNSPMKVAEVDSTIFVPKDDHWIDKYKSSILEGNMLEPFDIDQEFLSKVWVAHCKLRSIQPKYTDDMVTFCMLPLPYMCSARFIEACMVAATEVNHLIFDNPAVTASVDYLWENSGVREHHCLSLVLHALHATLVAITVYTFHSGIIHPNPQLRMASWAVVYVLIITSILKTFALFVRLGCFFSKTSKNIAMSLLYDSLLYVLMDVSYIILTFIAMSERIRGHGETLKSVQTLALASVCVCLKSLYYLRPYKSTGYLIKTMQYIIFDTRYFMLVLCIVLFGFAQALYLLSYGNGSLDFAYPGESMLHTFTYMMGGSVYGQTAQTTSPYLATALIVGLIFMAAIIMLNLLIALMGDTFNKIKKKIAASVRLERAAVVLDHMAYVQDFQWLSKTFHTSFQHLHRWSSLISHVDPEYVFCLKRTKDYRAGGNYKHDQAETASEHPKPPQYDLLLKKFEERQSVLVKELEEKFEATVERKLADLLYKFGTGVSNTATPTSESKEEG